jgi:hypothetical protein
VTTEVPLPPCVIEIEVGFVVIEKSGVTVIVRSRVCEWVTLPLVPVIITVAAEAGVPGSTFTVAADVTDPPAGGVTLGGENDTCTPLGKELALRSTAELNASADVTVTVSVAEPPEPMLSVGELRDIEKSAAEVMVSEKDVVWVPDEPVPPMVIALVPGAASEAMLTARLAEAVPPEGIEIGLGSNTEKPTPVGTDPVTESATVPEKLSCETPVIVTVPEPPWATEIVEGEALRLKSGTVGTNSASLFAPLSKTQMLPDESTTTSCGWVLVPIENSVNCPFSAPILGALVGETTFDETTAPLAAAEIARAASPEGDVTGAAATTEPPAEGSSSATFPFPAFAEFSAVQGCCVKGSILITRGSAPIVGICHSLIVLSPRRTPT